MTTRTQVIRENLHKNKKLCETIFACSFEAQVESFKQQKISWHCPFKAKMRESSQNFLTVLMRNFKFKSLIA